MKAHLHLRALGALVLLCLPGSLFAQAGPRARDLGIPFDGEPGPLNAITDVAGVEVGHVTLIEGEGALVVGQGPVRTGVTAILPRGKAAGDTVFAGWYSLNSNGEMTGTLWIDQSGVLEGPVLITNTHSVGVVRDAVIAWMMDHRPNFVFALPVVAETYDGILNDTNGFHVEPEHALAALDGAASGPVAEGNVGGGTGMVCHWFKGGIGTASRRLPESEGGYTVGVLVQCNYGSRQELSIAGVPVGRALGETHMPCFPPGSRSSQAWFSEYPFVCGESPVGTAAFDGGLGSIIVVVATDAPLLPHQLDRVAARVALGVGRMGGKGENSSGDIFLAFSTANRSVGETRDVVSVTMLPNDAIDPIFYATVQATEEAIVNALVAAETMEGVDGFRMYELPEDRVREILREHGRLIE
jgi:L-aminopeptidase/D-esterase-like protein